MLRKIRCSVAICVLALLVAGAAQALPVELRSAVRAPEQAGLAAVWSWLASLWGGRVDSRGDRPAGPEAVDVTTAGPAESSPVAKGGGHMDPNG